MTIATRNFALIFILAGLILPSQATRAIINHLKNQALHSNILREEMPIIHKLVYTEPMVNGGGQIYEGLGDRRHINEFGENFYEEQQRLMREQRQERQPNKVAERPQLNVQENAPQIRPQMAEAVQIPQMQKVKRYYPEYDLTNADMYKFNVYSKHSQKLEPRWVEYEVELPVYEQAEGAATLLKGNVQAEILPTEAELLQSKLPKDVAPKTEVPDIQLKSMQYSLLSHPKETFQLSKGLQMALNSGHKGKVPMEVKPGKTDLVAVDTNAKLPAVVEKQSTELVTREKAEVPELVHPRPDKLILAQNNHVEIIEFNKAETDTQALTEVKPTTGDLVVQKSQITDVMEVKPEIKEIVEVTPEAKELLSLESRGTEQTGLMVINEGPKELMKVEKGATDLMTIKNEPKDLAVIPTQTKDVALIKNEPKDLVPVKEETKALLVPPKQVTDLVAKTEQTGVVPYTPGKGLSKYIRNPSIFPGTLSGTTQYPPWMFTALGNNPVNYAMYGRSPMAANRPVIIAHVDNAPKTTDGFEDASRFHVERRETPKIEIATRKGWESSIKKPTGRNTYKDYSLGGRIKSGVLNNLKKNPQSVFGLGYYGNDPFMRAYRAMIERQGRLMKSATMNKSLGGYEFSKEDELRSAQAYFGTKAQMMTQFDLVKNMNEAYRGMVSDMKNKKVDLTEEYTNDAAMFSQEGAINWMEKKKLPVPETVRVFMDDAKGEMDSDKVVPTIWEKIFDNNRFLKDKEPISAFRGIYKDEEAERVLQARKKDKKYQPTPKAVWAARAEMLMTATPVNYDYDILMDLPMQNYLLNIEEACIESDMRPEACDKIISGLYKATTLFGSIIRRDYKMIDMLMSVMLHILHKDFYHHLLEKKVLPGFKDFSQAMYDRLEYLLIAFKRAD